MKPTSQQIELLKNYLRYTLAYRETYEEIYDHVLSAVEDCTSDISFQDAVNNIIHADFGGAKGLIKIEKQYHHSVVDEVIGQQWRNFTESFKFPEVIYSLLLWGVIYYSLVYVTIQPYFIMFLNIALLITPRIVILIRSYKIGRAYKDVKTSIKDKILRQVSSIPILIIILLSIAGNKTHFRFAAHPFIMSLLLFTITLYVVAFIKLCRQDFKAYQLT